MKPIYLLLAILLMSQLSLAQEIKGYVNDYADILSPQEEQQLEFIAEQIFDSGKAQYAIVTVKSLESKDIESYSLQLAQGNLGDKEKNNGLLLLVSVEDRQYRFEVGRGIEDVLNDAKVGRIGRNYIVPNLKEGNYAKGIINASIQIRDIFQVKEIDGEIGEVVVTPFVVFTILSILFLIIMMTVYFTEKQYKDRYFDAAKGAIIVFGGKPPFGGGGFSGGSGGFGGGGSFSGGGASGRW